MLQRCSDANASSLVGQLVVLAGGAAGARQIQKQVRRAQREQVSLAVSQLSWTTAFLATSQALTVHCLITTEQLLVHKSERLRAGMQIALCAEIDQSSRNGAGKGKKNKVAVDAVFFQRIGNILGMCVNHTHVLAHLVLG